MKSKTRHVDGGSSNPLVHGEIRGTMSGTNEISEEIVGSTKTSKSKSVSQSKGKCLRNKKHDTLMVEVVTRVFMRNS